MKIYANNLIKPILDKFIGKDLWIRVQLCDHIPYGMYWIIILDKFENSDRTYSYHIMKAPSTDKIFDDYSYNTLSRKMRSRIAERDSDFVFDISCDKIRLTKPLDVATTEELFGEQE